MTANTLTDRDHLNRFIFEHTPIRGNIVHLNTSICEALQHHNYPPELRRILAELMAVSTMLAATLKMPQGSLTLQLQGQGVVNLLVVECTADLKLRATAQWKQDNWDAQTAQQTFAQLVGDGQLVITLDPKDGNAPYQGIVPLEGDSIAEIMQDYMQRSEQIDTHIWLASTEQSCAGMLLQKLPGAAQQEENQDAWNRIHHLAATVQADELLNLSTETILRRLFHEETVRLLETQPVAFACRCSRNGVVRMLKMLGQAEANAILQEKGNIEVHCDFCNAAYVFDAVDTAQIFQENTAPGSSALN